MPHAIQGDLRGNLESFENKQIKENPSVTNAQAGLIAATIIAVGAITALYLANVGGITSLLNRAVSFGGGAQMQALHLFMAVSAVALILQVAYMIGHASRGTDQAALAQALEEANKQLRTELDAANAAQAELEEKLEAVVAALPEDRREGKAADNVAALAQALEEANAAQAKQQK